MSGASRRFVSACLYGWLALSSLVLFPISVVIWLVTLPFDRRKVVLHRFTSIWGHHYVKLWPALSVVWSGVERVPTGPAVLVANHQSLVDVLVLFGMFRHFKWVSKSAIFRVPLIGWNMYLNGYVRLVRGDSESGAQMIDACLGHLTRGSGVAIFPEGSRTEDGELRPFKRGAFTIAVRSGAPIVPIVLDGTRDILPKRGFLLTLRRSDVQVSVLEPIPADATGGDVDALRDLVRGRMAAELARLRGLSLSNPTGISEL